MPKPQALPGSTSRGPRAELPPGPLDPRYVLAQIVDPKEEANLKPVVIRVVGSKLIIESEDKEALRLMNDLLRVYMSEGTKPSDRCHRTLFVSVI